MGNNINNCKFIDINGKWFYDAVVYTFNHGIMIGVSKTEFAPYNNMTVSMLDVALNRMIKVEKKFENGTPDITRIDAIKTVCKFVSDHFKKSFRLTDPIPFSDTNMLTAPERNVVQALYNAGIIAGDENNCLRPFDKLKRCEAAEILMRLDLWLKQ